VADELFVHGLLDTSNLDHPAALRRRLDGVLATLDDRPPRRLRHWWLLPLAVAAAGLLVAVLVRGAPALDARAILRAAVAATRHAGDRTYRVAGWLAGETEPVVGGEFDVRDAEHFVLRAHVHGFPLVIGADGGRLWCDGDPRLVAHLHGAAAEPGAFVLGFERMSIASPDALLLRLATDFDLPAPGPQGGVALAGRPLRHLIAHRRADAALPVRVELWIDPDDDLVRRLDLFWHAEARTVAPHPPQPPAEAAAEHALRLDLVGRASLASDWFLPERHKR